MSIQLWPNRKYQTQQQQQGTFMPVQRVPGINAEAEKEKESEKIARYQQLLLLDAKGEW